MRNKKRDRVLMIGRMRFIALLYIWGIIFLLGKAAYLQIFKGGEYREKVFSQVRGTIKLSPRRGIIVDRYGNLLATSLKVPSVYARPQEIENAREVARYISSILALPEEKVMRRLTLRTPFVWIKRWITPWEAEKLLSSGIKGIYLQWEYKRHYPNKEVGANLIGFVGVDGEGLAGLEMLYDRYLRGEGGELTVERDGRGRIVYIASEEPPSDIRMTLTIDRDIQYEVERILLETVEEYNARSGFAVFMNPKTGEVLAMASVPGFNPNVFEKYNADSYRNRAVTDIFEPGSTFKVFTLAAALEENLIFLDERIFCENGSMRVDDRVITDYRPFGWLTVRDVIVFSSNIGAAKIGWKVGASRLGHYIREFGFGRKTGIDFPGESPGMVKDPLRWVPVELATISFGQGIGVTGIQMLVAFSSVVNEGYLVKPFLVSSIIKGGKEVYRAEPTFLRRVISKEVAERLKEIMVEVVERGTGRLASVSGYYTGGKTGTSQKFDPEAGRYSREKYISSFMGFAPLHDTQVIGIVVVEEPRGEIYASRVAVPAFGRMMRMILSRLRLPYEREIQKAFIDNEG